MDLAPYFDRPFYVGYTVAGYELGLLPEADPGDGALTYWAVDDVSDVGDGIVTAAVRTPDGAVLGFIVNPHFQLP